MIKEDELRQLVNRMGMQLGLKAGDSYREDAGGRGYRETAPDEGLPLKVHLKAGQGTGMERNPAAVRKEKTVYAAPSVCF